jgi:hypothetical protein
VRLGLILPKELPGFGLDCIKPADLIAEEQGVHLAKWYDDRRGADGSGGRIGPAHAAGFGVECVDGSTGAAGEQVISDHGGWGEGVHIAFKAEDPLEFQLSEVGGGEAARRLITRVGLVGTPAVPVFWRRNGDGDRPVGALVDLGRRRADVWNP